MYINLVKVCDVTSCRHSFAARQPKAIQYLAIADWAAVLPDHLSTKLCGADTNLSSYSVLPAEHVNMYDRLTVLWMIYMIQFFSFSFA